METMKNTFCLTIRGKIILLAIAGILGTILLTVMNGFLNKAEQQSTFVSNHSQKIVQIVLGESLQVEKYIQSSSQVAITAFNTLHEQFTDEITQLQAAVHNSRFQSIAADIQKNEQQLVDKFTAITASMTLIDGHKSNLLSQSSSISEAVQEIITTINYDESMLILEGELLTPGLSAFRDEIKNIKNIINTRRIILQDRSLPIIFAPICSIALATASSLCSRVASPTP